MVTVSFAANFRGSAGSAASLAAANFASVNLASFVIPSEARNLLFAASPPELSHAAAPIPLAACRINSLRFMTPPLFSSGPSHYLVWTPASSGRYHYSVGTVPVPGQAPPSYAPCKSPPRVRHTAPRLPFRPPPYILFTRIYHRNSKTRKAPPSALQGPQGPAGRLARRGKAQRLECRGVGRRRGVSSPRPSAFRRHARGNAFRRAQRRRSPRARHRPPRARRPRHGRAVRAHGLRRSCPSPSLRQAARRRREPRNDSPAFNLVRTRPNTSRLRRNQDAPRALRIAQQNLFRSSYRTARARPRTCRAPPFFRRPPARLRYQQRPSGQPRRNDVARRRPDAKPVRRSRGIGQDWPALRLRNRRNGHLHRPASRRLGAAPVDANHLVGPRLSFRPLLLFQLARKKRRPRN